MSLQVRFKKDYINYLISVVAPALLSGLSIPVFKHLLGPGGYGNFSLWFNAILIINAVSSGWIAQSILRLSAGASNKKIFGKYALRMASITLAILFVPAFTGIYYFSGDFLLAFLCVACLWAILLQFIVLSISQSYFLSSKVIVSELLRTGIYLSAAVCLLSFTSIHYLYCLLFAVFISYAVSLAYLYFHIKRVPAEVSHQQEEQLSFRQQASVFFKYGAPLSVWFIFAYLLTYIDKLSVHQYLSAEAQGNYQAVFDMLAKTITLLASPVIMSAYPLFSKFYDEGNRNLVKELLLKILKVEFVLMLLCNLLYWFIGAPLISLLLKVPDSDEYRFLGIIIISATFFMQMGSLIQKKYELKMQSVKLARIIFAAFLAQVIFYWIFHKSTQLLIYPMGYLLATVVYLVLLLKEEIFGYISAVKK